MADSFNLFGDQDWDSESAREGYRHLSTAIGKRLGGRLLGASLYELPPGEKSWPYHYEVASEEWALVVAGRPTLRTPDGEQELDPGDIAIFPPGPEGAHQFENRTAEPARIVIFSSKGPLDLVHYPDTGKIGVWTADKGYVAIVREQSDVDYWQVEET
jgi:uncharacterized cupin superfamily protein